MVEEREREGGGVSACVSPLCYVFSAIASSLCFSVGLLKVSIVEGSRDEPEQLVVCQLVCHKAWC